MSDLVVQRNGNVRMIYDEAIDMHSLGDLSVRPVSQVEPVEGGLWIADLVFAERSDPWPVQNTK